MKRWLWTIWAAIYAAGFAVLWAAEPAADWPYYAWAIPLGIVVLLFVLIYALI